MGLLSIIRKQKSKDRELRVLVLGLDNAGKTTIVKQWLHEDITEVSPTMGFNISTITHGGYTLNIWDVGGQSSLRPFWGNYFEKTNIIIWVVDCLAVERIKESFEELEHKILTQNKVGSDVALLILMNKVDLVPDPAALRTNLLAQLDLQRRVPPSTAWGVQMVSGKTGDGILNALGWCVSEKGATR
ncbi:ARF/SAR superfamily protein [Yamadazyma tenuis ATCC 10573]|uniref:ARF/SAR superfamily protein n=1 Tax=Candida tenuis (strain ATCC 10573 / BCRC 21748 / CBS 615 / JCM 9827 / NBRC 10315 / NRRL Y-1498 / VKM Y-70) TaxID=590646 RepID=G3BFR3_CANTC|nr:ARF/SAR superfamily protein [Yamadazyma tenuis ATCC 10573]EGV60715.1 ARF/SAR superfamily protein [Yamadazyma tenuis ATCC 10573]